MKPNHLTISNGDENRMEASPKGLEEALNICEQFAARDWQAVAPGRKAQKYKAVSNANERTIPLQTAP